MAGQHAKLSPSSAHRWRRCPGSITAETEYPDTVGIEAAEGTLFHEYVEMALTFGLEPHDFTITGEEVEIDGHMVSFDQEMIDNMYEGLDWIYDQLEEDSHLYVEQRVDISRWTGEPGGFGTSDTCIITPSQRRMIIFDWKYGKIPVSPYENDQAMIYGLGCWDTFGREILKSPSGVTVDIVIQQPRVPGGGGMWSTNMKKLLREGGNIRADADRCHEVDAPRIAGSKQCQWCKAQVDCPALAAYNLRMFQLKFADLDDGIEWEYPPPMPEEQKLTPEQRSYILLHADVFKRWLDKLHAAAMDDAAHGRPTPFLKMVAGRAGRRKFIDEHVRHVLRRAFEYAAYGEVLDISLKSPAQLEKIVGRKIYGDVFSPYVFQPPPGNALVPTTDTREALAPVAQAFDDLDEDDGQETLI